MIGIGGTFYRCGNPYGDIPLGKDPVWIDRNNPATIPDPERPVVCWRYDCPWPEIKSGKEMFDDTAYMIWMYTPHVRFSSEIAPSVPLISPHGGIEHP